ncbi:MAG: M1 family metallopeptidase [Anaerolineales bacterium]|nr:M1 family metallopeptidase [Anaerolineales bacterium]
MPRNSLLASPAPHIARLTPHVSRFTFYALLITLFSSLLLTSCASPVSSPTPSTVTPNATLTLTPFGPLVTPTETSTPSATPIPAPERPQVTLYATFDYDAHYLSVEQTILYPNQTGERLDNLLLAVEANAWRGGFILDSLTVDGQASTAYTLEKQRLEINLSEPLAPGAELTLGLKFQLTLPRRDVNTDPNDIRPQIYGWTAQASNLTHWFPFIVPYVSGKGWLLHNPWFYGEHLVYEAADFEVNLRFTDAARVPVVAASAPGESNGEWTRYRLEKARTFALSASREYAVKSQTAGAVTVYSYYYPYFESAGEAVLQATAQAVQIYSERFGPPPHAVISAVQADFNDGMEYSGLYFLSRDYYNQPEGTPGRKYLTAIAVHEAAHQWWFELVANDQALEPWLDEALCTYSEHIYFESASPATLNDWWWPARIDYFQPAGWVDTPVSKAGGYEPYRQAVYLRGARFLEALRQRIGDEAFFAFLKDYAAQMAFERATAADFFAILRQHTSVDISDIIEKYFKYSH